MKYLHIPLLAICAIAIGFTSCKKSTKLIDENTKTVFLDSANSANVKFIQVFAGNTPQLPTASHDTTGPQVFIYANGQKLNAQSLGYGANWPTTAVYANLPVGNTKFDIILARLNLNVVPNVPQFMAGDTIASITTNLEKGKYYSFYLTDTVPIMRIVVKEDILITPNEGTFKVRVANFFINNPTDTISLFSARKNEEIIKDITHKNVSDWVELPLSILSDTLAFRKKGTTTNFGAFNGFNGTAKRLYTIIGRGKFGVRNKRPSVAFILNR